MWALKKFGVNAGSRIMAPSSCVGLAMASTAPTMAVMAEQDFQNPSIYYPCDLEMFPWAMERPQILDEPRESD